jgi:signal transduction histidine kinase
LPATPRTKARRRDGAEVTVEVRSSSLRTAQGVVIARSIRESATPGLETMQLTEIALALAGARTEEEIVDVVLRCGAAALGAQSCALHLLCEGGLVRHTLEREDALVHSELVALDGASPVSTVVASAVAQWQVDATDSDEEATLARGCIPLVCDGRILGALTVDIFGPHAPSSRAHAESLALHAGLSLGRAHLREAERAARTSAQHTMEQNAMLRELTDTLTETLRARSDVLAAVSHDLKNPLTAILMAAQGLLQGIPNDRRLRPRREVELIRRSARRMTELIDALLEAAGIEAGTLSIHRRPHSTRELVEEVCELLEPLAAQRAIRLQADIDAELPPVPCDGARITRVLSNLVGNALKFSGQGSTVTASAHKGEGGVEFEVRDDGPGIPPEQLPYVFDRFWRGPRASQPGSGLGLFIAKSIVEAHGGTIGVESTVGVGTIFRFSLPSPPPPSS